MANIELEHDAKHFIDTSYCLALDIAQTQDWSAATVIEQLKHSHVTRKGKVLRRWEDYNVRHIERLPQHVPYPQQVEFMRRMYGQHPLNGTCDFIIDDTGVGRAVGDLFNSIGLNPIRVSITGGDGQTQKDATRWNVSKMVLISHLDAWLHSGGLRIAKDLPEAQILRDELAEFRRKVTESNRTSFEAAPGKHDDIIMSAALGLWNFVGRTRYPTAYVGRATFT